MAKTLLRSDHVPLGVFDGYTVGGINWAWAALIVPWHAIQAVLAPIGLISWLDPATSLRTWLPRPLFGAGVVLSILIGSFAFFVVIKPPASPIYLLTFFAIITGLAILARQVPLQPIFVSITGPPTWFESALGFVFHPTFVVSLCLMSATRAPTYLITTTSTLWLTLLFWLLNRGGLTLTKIVTFCLSDCLSAATVTGLIMAAHGNIPGTIADQILATFFIVGLL